MVSNEIPCDTCIVKACCTMRCPEIIDFLIENEVMDISTFGGSNRTYLYKDRKFKVPFSNFDLYIELGFEKSMYIKHKSITRSLHYKNVTV